MENLYIVEGYYFKYIGELVETSCKSGISSVILKNRFAITMENVRVYGCDFKKGQVYSFAKKDKLYLNPIYNDSLKLRKATKQEILIYKEQCVKPLYKMFYNILISNSINEMVFLA